MVGHTPDQISADSAWVARRDQDMLDKAIAERDQLRAENEQLRRLLEIWRRNGGDTLQRAEIERLQEEIKTLNLRWPR